MNMRTSHYRSVLTLVSVMMLLSGCSPMVVDLEEPGTIKIESMDHTHLKGMQIDQLLETYGPPLAVARSGGQVLYIPQYLKADIQEVEPIEFIKKFDYRHQLTPSHTVYYYQRGTLRKYGVRTPSPAGTILTKGEMTIYRLWILIDEESQKVVDFIMEKKHAESKK